MSFILDALKKSEAERQRQSGPTLLELRITQPRRRYPAWALWVGVLLAINAAVLLYALLRRPATPQPVVVAAPAAAPTGTVSAVVPAVPVAPPAAPVGSSSHGAAGATAAIPAGSDTTPVGRGATPPVAVVAPLAPPQIAGNAAAQPSPNPADDEPAVPASSTAQSGAPDYATLPSLSSIGGDVPSLQLNLLDYSPVGSERFALINMHRVHDGDVLPEGPRVLAITREGVALDYHGQQFMLRSGGTPTP